MMGHTGEHLLFGGLERAVPGVGIVKIFISPESKYVVVDRDVGWDDINRAQEFVNVSVRENLSVIKSTMGKDDPDIENVRAKMERIDSDLITVVEIGDADIAACGGLHVRETGEVLALIVDRKVSAGKDGYAIHFRVGNDALGRSMELANKCLQMVEMLGTKPEDAVKAAQNLKHDHDVMAKQMRAALLRIVDGIRPETVNAIRVYSGIFETNDKTVVIEAAENIRNAGGVSVFLVKGDSLSVLISAGVKNLDCSAILRTAMTKFGGKGGGKPDFAQGGAPETARAKEISEDILHAVKDALKQEN
jgi:alanyl-tRNA synthetase